MPEFSSPGTGVAAEYDLVNSKSQKGFIEQDVYVPSTEKGTSNILIQYGHNLIAGEIGLGVYPYGLGITPKSTVEEYEYWLTLSW